jgi:disulfide bond formation protein DsbB
MKQLQIITQTLSVKTLLIFILLGIFAFFILEFGFKLQPCKLCLIQRIPYYIALACVLILPPKPAIYCVLACFIFAFCVAIFNILVEEGLITYTCNSLETAETITDLKRQIYSALPECTLKPKIWGMRITILSALYSLLLILTCILLIFSRTLQIRK